MTITPYLPMKITGNQTGLVMEREEMILPNDAYPILENAFVWRERIKRKQGAFTLGRFRRLFTAVSIGTTGVSVWDFNLFAVVTPAITEPNAEIQPGSLIIVIGGAITLTDQGDGILTSVTANNSGNVDYFSGNISIKHTAGAGVATTATFNYYPALPVMGLPSRQLTGTSTTQTIGFDTKYAYVFASGWQEFISGTTWTGNNANFFWATNYWQTPAPANSRLFWVTNFSSTVGDPIRYTDSSVWIDFSPTIDAAGNKLTQALVMLPFRSRMMAFNTLEGANLAGSAPYPQRIRWAAIGNPISDTSALFGVGTVNANAWRDDIRGQGGFLDIPTSESIIAVGFVRDNLVIYCERSTWQLRYTGRSIAPFQIEKVNTNLGAESTFSVINFDTSLVGIGDKGVVECDSYQSKRIDIKIPDLVFDFSNTNSGQRRVYGVRDFVQRIAYWTYAYGPIQVTSVSDIFPNRRLVYNYENDSWAIYIDCYTALGTFQPPSGATWATTPNSWESQNYQWIGQQAIVPDIIGGNQQGFVMYLDYQTVNDPALSITGITGNTTTPTSIKVVNHNLTEGTIIKISNIPTGTPFATSLNGNVFYAEVVDANNLLLWVYKPSTDEFDTPQLDDPATYVGGGQIAVRDNFRIVSKKFNFLDEGESIQLGYIDVLMDATSNGAIQMKVYMNYNDSEPINLLPQNNNPSTSQPDAFFNATVPTTNSSISAIEGSKYWQRIYCPTRANFITIEWTLSNAQMAGIEQENNVQIDAQVLWFRKAGRMTNY